CKAAGQWVQLQEQTWSATRHEPVQATVLGVYGSQKHSVREKFKKHVFKGCLVSASVDQWTFFYQNIELLM
ncbi:hypothetical protein Tco_1528688, partial [Tanacetum coccineum]